MNPNQELVYGASSIGVTDSKLNDEDTTQDVSFFYSEGQEDLLKDPPRLEEETEGEPKKLKKPLKKLSAPESAEARMKRRFQTLKETMDEGKEERKRIFEAIQEEKEARQKILQELQEAKEERRQIRLMIDKTEATLCRIVGTAFEPISVLQAEQEAQEAKVNQAARLSHTLRKVVNRLDDRLKVLEKNEGEYQEDDETDEATEMDVDRRGREVPPPKEEKEVPQERRHREENRVDQAIHIPRNRSMPRPLGPTNRSPSRQREASQDSRKRSSAARSKSPPKKPRVDFSATKPPRLSPSIENFEFLQEGALRWDTQAFGMTRYHAGGRMADGTNPTGSYCMCIFCDANHPEDNCNYVTTGGARREQVSRQMRCFVCLRQDHQSTACKEKPTCRYCNQRSGKRHNQSICVVPEETEVAIMATNLWFEAAQQMGRLLHLQVNGQSRVKGIPPGSYSSTFKQ